MVIKLNILASEIRKHSFRGLWTSVFSSTIFASA
ncbi:unnamed protein product [Gongylonema pulchrum]|uniref:ABC transporter permease n=1 Tax=Gongylonema pulchrum TaxID=637853 RepID=A0A183DBD1_9BILA|nr:unnamed protein product [Gongylonema pulchrum]